MPEYYHEKCHDCGWKMGARKISKLSYVCDECWERRAWVVDHAVEIGMAEFQKIQKAMRGKRGTAKRRIMKLKEL